MRDLLRVLLRITAVTIFEALAVYVMARLLPGIALGGTTPRVIMAAISIAVVLGLLNGLIRPLIVLVGFSIHLYTVGLFTLVVNSGILLLSAYFLPNFRIESLPAAVLGALVLAVVNTFITGLVSIDQDYAYFDGIVSWLGRRNLDPGEPTASRGLVLLEIDGLSYERARRAIAAGLLPSMKGMLEGGSHRLTHVDSGFPSQSSSCQAAIMYGDNYDIPAFRWYEKENARLLVSNNIADAREINSRFFSGNGLLRNGTSVNNLLSGEAARSLMTVSTLRDEPGQEVPHSGYDLTLVFLNPYLLTRAVILTVWDLALEVFQALRQNVRNVRPRVNRLNRFYPFLRAALNVFLRDVGTNAVILDVMRGSPAIYMTFMGYDEIAHHAGPDSGDALNSLKGFDRALARILDVIERKAPRPYDVFILSDHGQSSGANFRQRSGYTLGEFIARVAAGKSFFAGISDAQNVRNQVAAVLSEIEGLQGLTGEGQTRADVLSRAGKSLGKRVKRVDAGVPTDTDLLVLVGGNLANVYFPQISGRATAPEIDELHPGLLESLVAHPDIGLVISHMDSGSPWAIGKMGARNLGDDTVSGGADPLRQYGEADLRARQIARVAAFPHAGDLIVISSVYDEDEVAAFEDHVGSHGGLGGQQTDAFLFHPADMEIPPAVSTIDLFALLDGRRGLLPQEPMPIADEPTLSPWSWPVMWAGISDVQNIFNRAARSLRLDRSLFKEVAVDPLATGQALLIACMLALGALVLSFLSLGQGGDVSPMLLSGIIVPSAGLAVCLILASLAGRRRHVPHSFTRALNALAYAGVGGFVAWFAPLDYVGPLLLITGTLIVLVACWLAIQEALGISRWPAVLIPLLSFTAAALLFIALDAFFGNNALTLSLLAA